MTLVCIQVYFEISPTPSIQEKMTFHKGSSELSVIIILSFGQDK